MYVCVNVCVIYVTFMWVEKKKGSGGAQLPRSELCNSWLLNSQSQSFFFGKNKKKFTIVLSLKCFFRWQRLLQDLQKCALHAQFQMRPLQKSVQGIEHPSIQGQCANHYTTLAQNLYITKYVKSHLWGVYKLFALKGYALMPQAWPNIQLL